MTGALYNLGSFLASKGQGAPYDILSYGYNQGIEEKNGIFYLQNLNSEAEIIAGKVKHLLPATFPFAVYARTNTSLNSINP